MIKSDPFGIAGQVIDGRYRVERCTAEGGFGVVYSALHLGFKHRVALKVLKLPEHWSRARREERIEAFLREGRMLFELSLLHPAIVRAFETGTIVRSAGVRAPYLALEWLDGIPMDQELRQRRELCLPPWSLPDVLRLLEGPVRALERAHARGITHRDIKPGNLFVTTRDSEPVIRILDFGVAKLVDHTASSGAELATPASFTPMYAAPEQWLERWGPTGPWTDVHALALVCVELLSGRTPFQGRECGALMAACLDPTRPTPRSFGIDVDPHVEAAFARALALDPAERFRDVVTFWQALGSGIALGSADRPSISLAMLNPQPALAAPGPARSEPHLAPGFVTTDPTVSHAIERPKPSRAPSAPLFALGAVALTTLAGAFLIRRPAIQRGASARHHPPAFLQPALPAEPTQPARLDPTITTPQLAPDTPELPLPRFAPRAGHVAARRVSAARSAPAEPAPSAAPSPSANTPPALGELPDVAAELWDGTGVNFDDPALTRRR